MGRYVRAAHAVLIVLCFCTVGCQFRTADPKLTRDVTFVLPGLDGPGPWYGGLIGGLRERENGQQVELFAWGAPLSILPNLLFSPMHDAAERKLAARVTAWREIHPGGHISLVGHSAGCGVILGSLRRLDPQTQVDTVVLLAPAVSDKYDLAPALAQVRGALHVFYSGRDGLLPSTFIAGTYDGRPGDSAGRGGFEAVDLPPGLREHLLQHPYQQQWASLGCGGGHFGWRAKPFVEQVLAPLLAADPAGDAHEALAAKLTRQSPPARKTVALPQQPTAARPSL